MTKEQIERSRIGAFSARIPELRNRLEQALKALLPPADTDPARLHGAMRYACEGGKRLRGLLVYATGEALGLGLPALDAPACAVELIHAYSLVHDDLPAMDDDALRRGRPTVHKAYDEATGILVGDALQTLAFEALVRGPSELMAERRVAMVASLARASGSLGMVGGQAVDIESEGRSLTLERLQSLHARKTGALILCAVELATLAAGADARLCAALRRYGECVGLAYQIQDDVLDETASTETLGKTAGKDRAQHKSTYPSLMGLEQARLRAAVLFDEARAAVALLGARAEPLLWFTEAVQQRGA